MKRIILILLLATLFIACDKPCSCSGEYTVDKHSCICIKFKAKIGNDFDAALDSLKRQYEPKFNTLATEGHYSGKGYFIEKEKINVDFTDDNRAFFKLTFIDSLSIYNYIVTNDVIDEKGNYYLYIITLRD